MKRPARSRAAPAPLIDVVIESPRWKAQPGAAAAIRKAIAAAAKAASTPRAELAIVLTDDSTIRALNREWRGRDAPTNVLSFPARMPQRHGAHLHGNHLGDIVVAYQTLAREAKAESKPFRDHLTHLAVHGFLHLVGYDHETDKDANKMERLEVRILAGLDVPDPYSPRHGAA